MIYQELLYSRSLSKDYRWMIVPQKATVDGLKALNQLYNMYDKYKDAFRKASVLPLYCLNHAEATYLVSCGLSDHKDKDGRDIYCLQGICVTQEHRRHFWFILPRILAHDESKGLLNRWKNIDFSVADDILSRTSEDYSFMLCHPDEPLAKRNQTGRSALEKLPVNKPTYISFNKHGLTDLSCVLSLYHDCTDFAFGATPEMVKYFPFKVIAKVTGRSKREKSMEVVTAGGTPSRVPDNGQTKPMDEHFMDPIDRFDPRKKTGDTIHKMKTTSAKKKLFGGSGTSRMVSQFFPRLLSVFKMGKKLKRQKGSDH